MPPEKPHGAHLFSEVVPTGLGTGGGGRITACPSEGLKYDGADGPYKPFHVDEEGGFDNCTYGERGCTLCTRACPRFRLWEPEIDTHLFGREREVAEVEGVSKDVVLARAVDPELQDVGQDGGLVSAILIWALDHGFIDAALVSYLEGDGTSWKAIPGVARTRAEIIASAGSRYTYSANTMAYAEAVAGGAEKLALVGMSCQSSVPPV